jgi:hypothetical protein
MLLKTEFISWYFTAFKEDPWRDYTGTESFSLSARGEGLRGLAALRIRRLWVGTSSSFVRKVQNRCDSSTLLDLQRKPSYDEWMKLCKFHIHKANACEG